LLFELFNAIINLVFHHPILVKVNYSTFLNTFNRIFDINMKKTKVEKHFDKIAKDYDFYKKKNSFYYDNLKKLLKDLIPPDSSVLEFGCGTGDLLVYLSPKKGVGYDISSEMIKIADSKHRLQKNIQFTYQPLTLNNQLFLFDYIFMSDVIEHLQNPEQDFKNLSKLMDNKTKLIITMANPIWEPFLMMAEKFRLKMPEGPHNRMAFNDLRLMINDLGMRIIKHDYKLLVPVKIPIITNIINKILEAPLKKLAFIEYFVITKV